MKVIKGGFRDRIMVMPEICKKVNFKMILGFLRENIKGFGQGKKFRIMMMILQTSRLIVL